MGDKVAECLAALDALYNHPDPQIKHRADLFLIALQKDPFGWQVADQLLHRSGLHETAYYFAANTLHSKLLFAAHELPDAQQRASFKNSLLTHIRTFKQGSNTVKTRLALCVACLGVHLLGLGEWTSCLDDLIQAYGPDPLAAPLLLDILAYMPEENHNPKLLISAHARKRAREELLGQTSKIMALLLHFLGVSSSTPAGAGGQPAQDFISSGILHTPNSGPGARLLPPVSGAQREMQKKVLGCFLAWVKATGHSRRLMASTGGSGAGADPSAPAGAASLVSSTYLIAHPLLLFCFKSIASRVEDLEQIAIDVLGSLLKNFNLVSKHVRGGFRGFHSARRELEEQEGGEGPEEGEADDEDDGPSRTPQSSPTNGANEPSQYEHIYFMRWMIARIVELVPLFDALPVPAAGADELDSSDADLARCYGQLFVSLGEYYLDFIMEFCVGVAGFAGAHEQAQLHALHRTMVEHATAAQTQPALLAATPVPQNSPQVTPGGLGSAAAGSVNVTMADVEQLIQSNKDLSTQVIQLQLKCSAHPRREVHSNSLYFWFLLSEALSAPVEHGSFGRNNSNSAANPQTPGAPAPLSPLQVRQMKREAFFPVFLQMVSLLHRIMTFPPNYTPTINGQVPPTAPGVVALSAEEEEDVYKSRRQASDVLLDLERLVTHGRILEILCSEQCMGVQVRNFVVNPQTAWRELEASLFCIRTLGKRVCDDVTRGGGGKHGNSFAPVGQPGGSVTNSTLVPQILDLLLDPASPVLKNTPIKYTSLNILAEYATWVSEHGKFQNRTVPSAPAGGVYLQKSLSAIVDALSDPSVCSAAARAFSSICEKNTDVLANSKAPAYLPNLMAVFHHCCSISVIGTGRNESGLTLEDQKRIIEGVAAVVSCVKSPVPAASGAPAPEDELPRYLQALVQPMVEGISKILSWVAQQQQQLAASSPTASPAAAPPAPVVALPHESSLALSSHLVRLSETFAQLHPDWSPNRDHFVGCILQLVQHVISPLLFQLMAHCSSDENRMDKLVRVWKWLIKTTRLHFLPQLQTMLEHLSAAFNRHPHACFLYLLSICIDHFGPHPAVGPMLSHLLPPFLARSLSTIPSTQAMVNDPDMTEDFFETGSKILNRCPEKLFALQMLPQIIEHAVFGLCLHHKDSLSAVTHFLSIFLEHGVAGPRADRMRQGPLVPEHAQAIHRCVTMYGPAICNQLIASIAYALPMYRLHMLTGVLHALISFAGEGCHPWLATALATIPDTVDPTKVEFQARLFAYNPHTMRQDALREMIDHFGYACRVKDS